MSMKFLKENAVQLLALQRAWLVLFAMALAITAVFLAFRPANAQTQGRHLITVYDRGVEKAFLSDAATLGEALQKNGIELDTRDTVEPSRQEELVAPEYQVNIYRARPVIVVDGTTRLKTMTPYQTVKLIAKDAGIELHSEDIGELQRSTDLVGDGAGLQLVVKRATPIILDLYGQATEVRTQAATIGEMLAEKSIELGANGRVSLPESTPITSGMSVRVWREGRQTMTLDQPIPYEIEQILDADREVGYRHVQTPGKDGVRTITYEVEIKDGAELSRVEIAHIITKTPSKEVVVVGIKSNPNSLTKSKGAHHFTDSNGVVHRETYYDLEMGRVMQQCGQNGYYTVRVDGVKVDAQGYVIIAANLQRYPRCSVVQTSVGPGKVYDTGGFAAIHPDGFDIATDWTNNNGR